MASQYFRACLGGMDEATEKRLEEWAQSHFVTHEVARTPAGDVVLHAQRGETKSSKSHKMALRTLFQNWGVPLGVAGNDWLQLLPFEEFSEAVGQAGVTAPPRTKHEPPPGTTTQRPCGSTGRPASTERVSAPPDGTVKTPIYLTALPGGFDERAGRMYKQLLEQHRAIACAA